MQRGRASLAGRAPVQTLKGGGASRTLYVWLVPAASALCTAMYQHLVSMAFASCILQLSAMDVSVRSTMKGAAKCDKHCELQTTANRQGLERILCFWVIPESTPASVSTLFYSSSCNSFTSTLLRVPELQGARLLWAPLRHQIHMALLRQPAD